MCANTSIRQKASPAHDLQARLVPIVFEDDHLLAVDKPAGLDAGGRYDGEAPGLVELLFEWRGRGERLYAVNRLSRYESGVLLLAKSESVARELRHALRRGRVHQHYLAVVQGDVLSNPLVVGQTARKSGAAQRAPGGLRRRGKRARTFIAPNEAPTAPTTTLRPLRQGLKRALIECRTTAPSTHELRAHVRSTGLRILGDKLHVRSPKPVSQVLTCLHLLRLSVRHPRTYERMAIACARPRSFMQALDKRPGVERVLHAAAARRLPVLIRSDLNAYRLLTGRSEDLPGVDVERFGPMGVIYLSRAQPLPADELSVLAKWYRETFAVESVYVKRSPVAPAVGALSVRSDTAVRSVTGLLAGRNQPETIEVREGAFRFLVWPREPFSVGLFPDQRDNRARVASWSAGRAVLNLFAYTCTFSVAAAAGGARSTVSVDISGRNLARGKANFELNGLSTQDHEFEQSGAWEYCKKAARLGRSFDLVVIDPPTFAHGRTGQRDFSIVRDLAELAREIRPLLTPGAVLLVNTNHRRLTVRGLLEWVRAGLGRPVKLLETPPLPRDYAVDPDHAKSALVRV